jgi:hypothetical protein
MIRLISGHPIIDSFLMMYVLLFYQLFVLKYFLIIFQDRKFLSAAMADLADRTDPIKQMKKQLELLSTVNFEHPSDSDQQTAESCMDALTDLCLDVDIANGVFLFYIIF